jgi:hypothetical protein
MLRQFKIVLSHLLLVILAIELKGFYDNGGGNHYLAYSLLKIIFLLLACIGIINAEDVTRVVIEKFEEALTPTKLR